MRHILELAPDIIKLDRDVIAEIDADPARQALGTAMVGFAAGMGAQLVAEGVETAEELAAVTKMGMHAGQGYLLGRPSLDSRDWVRWTKTGTLTDPRRLLTVKPSPSHEKSVPKPALYNADNRRYVKL